MIKKNVIRLTDKEKEIVNYLRSFEQTSTIQKEVKYTSPTTEGDLYFILPDAHYPFHNAELMDKVFRCIEDNDTKGVVISGDWLDLYTLGSYNSDSLGKLRDITLSDEYESGLQGIKDLDSVLSTNAERYFLWGNHEDRYTKTLNSRDNAKFGSELRNPNDALELEKYGYQVKTNWKDDYFTIGDIDITHGTYHNIHVAKKHLEMHGRSIIFGHTHRFQTYCTGSEAAFNIGSLCDLSNPAFGYMPRMSRNQWSNGFAVITVIDGKSHVEPIIVRDNKFVFRGKVY